MKAPERILTTIEHREPDRVPAFESAFTNNTIIKHYGINLSGSRAAAAVFHKTRLF